MNILEQKKNISEITGICLITKRNGQKINKIKISIKSNFSFATKLVMYETDNIKFEYFLTRINAILILDHNKV